MNKPSVKVARAASYVRAECACGWAGVMHSTRQVESFDLVKRDVADHEYGHESGKGWWDFKRGWVYA